MRVEARALFSRGEVQPEIEMTMYKKPEERVTITRKPGETHETLNYKYRSGGARINSRANLWSSVSKCDFANTAVHDYKTPSKWGVMADRMAEQNSKQPKQLLTMTTYNDSMTVTNEHTAQIYTRPLREAPSVIAMRNGSQYQQSKRTNELAELVPRDLLRQEKQRLAAIKKEPRVESMISHINMPNYSGHEPKSPKNQRGPMLSGPETTSGHANLQGLGLITGA